jgi:hypothetical protein
MSIGNEQDLRAEIERLHEQNRELVNVTIRKLQEALINEKGALVAARAEIERLKAEADKGG